MAKRKNVLELNATHDLLGEKDIETNSPSKKEDLMDRLIQENFNTNNIEIRTDLTDKQIMAFSIGKVYAETFNVSIVNDFMDFIMKRSLSKKRKSREEFLEVGKSAMQNIEEDIPESFNERLLGRKR